MIGPIKVHVDNKGIIDGLWRRERKCIDPNAGYADLWENWQALHLLVSRDIVVEVEHVKAHRTKKDKKDISHSEKSLRATRKRMSWQKQEQCWSKDLLMAEVTAKTVQEEREEVYAALQ